MNDININEICKDMRQIAVLLFVAACVYGVFDSGNLKKAAVMATISFVIIIITNLRAKNVD